MGAHHQSNTQDKAKTVLEFVEKNSVSVTAFLQLRASTSSLPDFSSDLWPYLVLPCALMNSDNCRKVEGVQVKTNVSILSLSLVLTLGTFVLLARLEVPIRLDKTIL